MDNRKPVWMPLHEAVALKELMDKLEPEIIMKLNYYFWNNFSYEGYEEWKQKQQKMTNIPIVPILKVKETFEITGRGTVWSINLKDNNISEFQPEWKAQGIYLDAPIQRENDINVYSIKGMEYFYAGEQPNSHVGLLVKKLDNYAG